jgi:hypothetical protein
MAPPVRWSNDHQFELGGITFVTGFVRPNDLGPETFLLVKPRWMIEQYMALFAELEPSRVVELGIFEGGSTAFMALYSDRHHHVAVDLREDPVEPLDQLVSTRGMKERIITRYGVDQSDRATLEAIIVEQFGDAPLDLVIDDASHRVEPTRASFDLLFPRLRPGGVFVIEDWSGLHHWDTKLHEAAERDPQVLARLAEKVAAAAEPAPVPVTVLLFELVLASAFAPDLVAEVTIRDGWAAVVRGPGQADQAFRLSDTFSDHGARLINAGS